MTLLSIFHRCPPCEQPHIPEYVTSQEAVARLERLRDSAMSNWEGALMWGEGNYLTRVYAPMLVGLIDVAKIAEQLVEHPGNEGLRERLQGRLRDYLRDLDTAKQREQWERERREAQAAAEAARQQSAADAAAIARDNTGAAA